MPLDLDDANETKVFRRLVAILQADPTLARLVRPRSWFTWQGEPGEDDPLTSSEAPAIRLTPVPGPDGWIGPEAMRNDLTVLVEILLAGTDASDLLNFWNAIRRALYPPTHDAQMAIQRSLREAGAETGVITFTASAHDANQVARQDGMTLAGAQFKIGVLKTLNL
jgi:hypothetical protein